MVFDESQHPRGGDPHNQGGFSARPYNEAVGIELAPAFGELHADLLEVLEQAAELQKLVPDTVLVGGSASALYAAHRASYDHDHVISDLRDRFDSVLDALEREGKWVTNRAVPGKLILGQIGDIEAGVRQLIRKRPLEVTEVELPSGAMLRVPTRSETLRIKGFLVVKRNQTRDYLDVAALADRYGIDHASATLMAIDDYYTDPGVPGTPVRDQLVRQLLLPSPRDHRVTSRLSEYKGLNVRWQQWGAVVDVLGQIGANMELRRWS